MNDWDALLEPSHHTKKRWPSDAAVRTLIKGPLEETGGLGLALGLGWVIALLLEQYFEKQF